MNNLSGIELQGGRILSRYPLQFASASLLIILSASGLAAASIDLLPKALGFTGIVLVYLSICVLFLRAKDGTPRGESTDDRVERCLSALSEVNEFFAGSMRTHDMFRLVSSRIQEAIPLTASTLFLLDENREHLRIAAMFGKSVIDEDPSVEQANEIADVCQQNRTVEFGPEALSVAIPLRRGVAAFGVLHIELSNNSRSNRNVLEAIGHRVAPLILCSVAYEQSQANALTDATTDLPNENAFYLMLENQVAEVQRDPLNKSLSVLTIDIKNFDDINKRFGHASGDRTLNRTVQIIKDNLRQMDFIARSVGDEFLVILPTASKQTTREIIDRIADGLNGRKLIIEEKVSIEIGLNFGWASFGDDGETPRQLIAAARLRRSQAKSSDPNRVLWFHPA
jgi:diguanylate cyclase (GGDEF)-like protein